MKTRKNIIRADLGRVLIDRAVATDMDTGETTTSLRVELLGTNIDEDDKTVSGQTITKEYDWKDVPKDWQGNLEMLFKKMSREFNKVFADEDSETFEVTKEEPAHDETNPELQ